MLFRSVLLKAAGAEPGWLVGGVPRDLPDSSHPGRQGGPFVIEGDEYDTAFFDKRSKFIQYLPHVLALNNCEFDHADIFRDLDDVLRTFSHVIRIVPRDGTIVANGDDAHVLGLVKNVSWAPVVRVGTGAGNDAVIADFRESPAGSSFTLLWKGKEWGRVKWALPGLFNARNAAMAAVSAGLLLDRQVAEDLARAVLRQQAEQDALVLRGQVDDHLGQVGVVHVLERRAQAGPVALGDELLDLELDQVTEHGGARLPPAKERGPAQGRAARGSWAGRRAVSGTVPRPRAAGRGRGRSPCRRC